MSTEGDEDIKLHLTSTVDGRHLNNVMQLSASHQQYAASSYSLLDAVRISWFGFQ